MNAVPAQEFAENLAPENAERVHPQVFVRAFSIPPGAPWEQNRAAQLEARHGAPLPISELLHRVSRLGSWAPGRPGRFAAFYIRAREFQVPFETIVEVDGSPIKVAFGAAAEHLRRAQRVGLVALLTILSAAIVTGGLFMALHARSAAASRLERAELAVAGKLRAGRALQQQRAQVRALSDIVGQSARISDVVADLSWATSAKAPDARIVAVHWDHGLLGVEARGAGSPFAGTSRKIERSSRPIRPGVWLWGGYPAGPTSGGRASALSPKGAVQ